MVRLVRKLDKKYQILRPANFGGFSGSEMLDFWSAFGPEKLALKASRQWFTDQVKLPIENLKTTVKKACF
jgi:hypothetical protein